MKIDIPSLEFQPITITLETVEEAILLRELAGGTSPHTHSKVLRRHGYNDDVRGPAPRALEGLYDALYNALNPIAPHILEYRGRD